LLGVAAISTALTLAPAAYATEAEPYGEVGHFGGFDGTGSIPGKFDLPVGFAVDPSDPSTPDHNAVYVLDRTLAKTRKTEEGHLDYRLQKLSSSGSVLGSVVLPEESFKTEPATFSEAHPLISLAVDSAKQRLYALVESIVEDGAGHYVPVADELVAWSTVPNSTVTNGTHELEKASSYNEDPVTHAGLIANLLQSEASKDLYAPEGIAADPKTHEVVVEAQKGVSGGPIGGPTVLQRVITEGPQTGKLG